MREVILDTETTGLDPAAGHRVVEIGAVELFNHVASGKTFHVYINPERDMPPEAEAVHGLSTAFLKDKAAFEAIAGDFLAFIGDSPLVIHNASFDMGFINAELAYLQKPPLPSERVIDTLQIARQRHPSGPNSLDALCRRYGIDSAKRTKHGALLDSELLAEVYLELIGGRQTALSLGTNPALRRFQPAASATNGRRSRELTPRLTETERAQHQAFIDSLGDGALWTKSKP